jgi:uncharacterized protein (TIGR04540 family)
MLKIPTTVEGMGSELKKLCDDYTSDKINTIQLEAGLKYLKDKRQDLFLSALVIRFLGKKRIKLIQSVLGDIQIKI